jgi:hypothetical protein
MIQRIAFRAAAASAPSATASAALALLKQLGQR